MKTNWDLTVFYKDFDDPAFKADLGGLDASIAALTEAVAAPCEDEAAKLTALVGQVEALGMTFERLMLMVELTLSVDAQNKPANAAMAPLMRSAMLMEQANNALGRYLSKLENLSELVHSNETLSARAFALLEMAENAKHQLPEALEEPVMKMQLSGGQAFSQLRDKLDATLTVDYDGKAIPLSAARAMAYDADADVRRKAYDAELASYKKLEIPMSYCLNNIKAEGETMAKLRGYKGVLTIDGNNKDSIEDVHKFIEKLQAGYDFVQGSRFIRGGHAVNTPPVRYAAVRLVHAPLISLVIAVTALIPIFGSFLGCAVGSMF